MNQWENINKANMSPDTVVYYVTVVLNTNKQPRFDTPSSIRKSTYNNVYSRFAPFEYTDAFVVSLNECERDEEIPYFDMSTFYPITLSMNTAYDAYEGRSLSITDNNLLISQPIHSNIIFTVNDDSGKSMEMLKIDKDGFYVRGVKLPQDTEESNAVFQALYDWFVLNKFK